MYYGQTYRIQFQAAGEGTFLEGEMCEVVIYDTTTASVSPIEETVTFLTGAGDPMRISVVNDEEDKHSPIRAKQMEVRFLSTATVNASTFAAGEDGRYKVEGYSNGLKFTGFLLMDELEEDFQDGELGNEVRFMAIDGLALLKEIPLSDFNDEFLKGTYKVISYISWALSKTGIELPIWVANNLAEESAPEVCFYESCYLNAKTFEGNKPGEAENCYSVLTKILGQSAFLTQRHGVWWIVRVDEMDSYQYRVHKFGYDAAFQETEVLANDLEIGAGRSMFFTEETAMVMIQRPINKLKLTFKYDYPKEIVDNIEWQRGELITPLIPSMQPYVLPYANLGAFPAQGDPERIYKANDTGNYYRWRVGSYVELTAAEEPTASGFTLEDWASYKNLGVVNTTTTPYFKRIYVAGTVVEQYMVIPQSPIEEYYYVQANSFPVSIGDKISFSVDTRFLESVINGAQVITARILLYSGTTYYHLRNARGTDPTAWIPAAPTAEYNVIYDYELGEDETQWVTTAVESPPCPASGIIIIQLNHSTFTDQTEKHFANLQVELIPNIAGTYQVFTGHTHQVSQSTNKVVHDAEAFIGESPALLIKGTLQKLVSGSFVKAGRFYDAVKHPGTMIPADAEYLKPYGYWQAFALWNQKRRAMVMFDAKVEYLRQAATTPDITNTYVLTDEHAHTMGKRFALLHFEQDFMNRTWDVVLIEVDDNGNEKIYTDSYSFTYNSLR